MKTGVSRFMWLKFSNLFNSNNIISIFSLKKLTNIFLKCCGWLSFHDIKSQSRASHLIIAINETISFDIIYLPRRKTKKQWVTPQIKDVNIHRKTTAVDRNDPICIYVYSADIRIIRILLTLLPHIHTRMHAHKDFSTGNWDRYIGSWHIRW